MLNERAMYLINAEVDGELTAEEQEELAALLESSGEARAMKTELQKLANLLDAVPEKAPAPGLANHILDRLAPEPEKQSPLASLFVPFRPVPVGLAFAAGLLLTLSAYHNSGSTTAIVDMKDMTGTMLARPGEHGVLVDSFEVEETDLTGEVSLRDGEGLLVLEFTLESGGPAEIEITLDETGAGFGGVAVVSPVLGDMTGSYAVSGRTLRVVNQGRQTYSVFLPDTATNGAGSRAIRIELSTNGELRYSGELRG